MAEIKAGDFVLVAPTNMASEEFREKVKQRIGDLILAVVQTNPIGVCTIILPKGISMDPSRVFKSGEYEGCEYMDLHESHLTLVELEKRDCLRA